MTMHFSRRQLVLSGLTGALLLIGLNACNRDTIAVLPEGGQTMTGVLQPVAISITRRGSHMLMQNGEGVYYAESSTLNLRDYEGMEAVITGHLEYNTDPSNLPVLVVSGATLVQETLKVWEVPALKLSLEVPDVWSGHLYDNGIRFTSTGSAEVMLTVDRSSGSTLPRGTTQSIAGHRAVRVTGSGSDAVYIQNGLQIIVLTYADIIDDTTSQRLFNRILRTVRFTSAPTGTGAGTVPTGSGSAAGTPCGGPAGVLCPSGQYCEVTDPITSIGRCRSLKR